MKYYSLTNTYKDGSSRTRVLVGGKYKIVHYDYRTSGGYTEKRSTYCAYYIPGHFNNWGDHVNNRIPHYDSFSDALQACHDFDATKGHTAKFKKAA